MSSTSLARMYSVRSFFRAVSRFRMLGDTPDDRVSLGEDSVHEGGWVDSLYEGFEDWQLVFWDHSVLGRVEPQQLAVC